MVVAFHCQAIQVQFEMDDKVLSLSPFLPMSHPNEEEDPEEHG
jgi:hypothetical protein